MGEEAPEEEETAQQLGAPTPGAASAAAIPTPVVPPPSSPMPVAPKISAPPRVPSTNGPTPPRPPPLPTAKSKAPLPPTSAPPAPETPRSLPPETPRKLSFASLPPSLAAKSAPPRTGFEFERARKYAFALDDDGMPIVVGSGRFSRLYLGYERWEESVTHQHRPVVIKMLERDLEDEDVTRFRQEKALLEYLQGHPSIVELLGSGTIPEEDLPDAIKLKCEGDYLILEKLDMTLMERLKGTRDPKEKEDLLALDMHERLVRALQYVVPVASAVEYAHLVKNVSHRDINPSNIMLKLPDPKLAGSSLQVRLVDFSAGKMEQHDGVTRIGASVPGTMYFQSPEQETNLLGLRVNVKQGSRDVEYFDDFYMHLAKNDTFAIVNHPQQYLIRDVDRAKRRIVLETPYAEGSEQDVRANVQKRVGRPADIYAIGALLYYLMSGAARNPKTLNDELRKFDEYDRPGAENEIETYLRSEYEALESARSKADTGATAELLRYQHLLDGKDTPIPFEVMRVVARCMIRNKTDSYCTSNDLETTAISQLIRDLVALYPQAGIEATIRAHGTSLATNGRGGPLALAGSAMSRMLDGVVAFFKNLRR
jgi:serine/threonine protein kinase